MLDCHILEAYSSQQAPARVVSDSKKVSTQQYQKLHPTIEILTVLDV